MIWFQLTYMVSLVFLSMLVSTFVLCEVGGVAMFFTWMCLMYFSVGGVFVLINPIMFSLFGGKNYIFALGMLYSEGVSSTIVSFAILNLSFAIVIPTTTRIVLLSFLPFSLRLSLSLSPSLSPPCVCVLCVCVCVRARVVCVCVCGGGWEREREREREREGMGRGHVRVHKSVRACKRIHVFSSKRS